MLSGGSGGVAEATPAVTRAQGRRGLVLRAAGRHEVRWRPGERLHHLFEERCDRLRREGSAERLAVDADGDRLTYDELDARANRLARHLLAQGARPGDRVALLFDEPVRSYVAMLAVSKAGAAYVPLDVGFPDDRLGFIVEDAGARLVLTLSHLRERLPSGPAQVVCLDEQDVAVGAQAGHRLRSDDLGTGEPEPDALSYLIYTSGSTGRPKGVAIDSSSICNFLRVAGETYGMLPTDRVYQGMTIAFDFSVEEIWVPWMAGATLVPKPPRTSLVGADLTAFLQECAVTALVCVPTLLATLDERELTGLRFLLVSGEACPRDLVTRWHRPGRRFLNVYGPTEATVTATWTVLEPDRPVTIGAPLPTYAVVVLDPETHEPLPAGEVGEIALAGPGLARGYVNRDDLTAKAFLPDPLGIPDNPSGRIYRTGDLGRIVETGDVEYLGRIDLQVKIRGYRIELTEIESVMLQVPGVAQAVVDTYAPEEGTKELVGYFTCRTPGAVAPAEVSSWLRERVPPYMVPAYLEELPVIPMLPSDKADRKALPRPRNPRITVQGEVVVPTTPLEAALAGELAAVLGLPEVSVESHLFEELGADSLRMARFCARVREEHPDVPAVSMRDVYAAPTIRGLAAALGDTPAAPAAPAEELPEPYRASTGQYVLCGVLQLLVFLSYTFVSALIAVASYRWVAAADGLVGTYLRSLAFGAGSFVYFSAVPVALKWLLVGRWTEREIPVWSVGYVRFWTVKTLVRANPMAAFVGSPLYVLYLRALGARVGRGVTILSGSVPVCTDLLTIGDGTVIRKDSFFPCYRAHSGRIQMGRVTIGSGVWIGEKTVLDIGVAMGDGSQLGHCSSLHAPQAVPAGATWHGSPAQPTELDYRDVPPVAAGRLRRVAYSSLQLVNALVLVLPIGLGTIAALIDEYVGLDILHLSSGFVADLVLLSLALYFGPVVGGLALVLTLPRLLHRLLEPGRVYPLYGFHYAVHRTIAGMTNAKFYIDLFGDSSYITTYLSKLGYDLGVVQQTGSNFGTEVGHESPYLVSIGSGTVVSDSLSLMNAQYSSSSFRLTPVVIGERNFLGNNIAYPPGSRTGENCLLATKVMIPVDGAVRRNVGLLGSPPFEIPRSVDRDISHACSGEELRSSIAAKNRYNLSSMALFLLVRWFRFLLLLSIGVAALDHFTTHGFVAIWLAFVALPFVIVGYGVLIERLAAGFRPLQPRICSIYDPYFWWHERLWKLLGGPIFNGTPFKNVEWRLLGVRLGRHVFDDGVDIPEKTLVTIGDGCSLNQGSVIQCHSLEDGTFKSDHTVLGAGCTLGVESFVHYGVTLGDGAVLGADSFLMKGEVVPAGAHWRGNPARGAVPLPVAPPDAPPELPPAATDTARTLRPHELATLLAQLRVPVPDLPDDRQLALWVLSLRVPPEREPELHRLLSAAEREQVASLPASRRAVAAARLALVRAVLTVERPDVTPSDWVLGHTPAGRPVVLGPIDVRLSVSHTDDLLAVALSETVELGVDVEGGDHVVWDALAPEERRHLTAIPERSRRDEFLRMWTLKEAYVKCTGTGASVAFESIETGTDVAAVVRAPDTDAPAPTWFFHTALRVDGRAHALSLAAAIPARGHRSRPAT